MEGLTSMIKMTRIRKKWFTEISRRTFEKEIEKYKAEGNEAIREIYHHGVDRFRQEYQLHKDSFFWRTRHSTMNWAARLYCSPDFGQKIGKDGKNHFYELPYYAKRHVPLSFTSANRGGDIFLEMIVGDYDVNQQNRKWRELLIRIGFGELRAGDLVEPQEIPALIGKGIADLVMDDPTDIRILDLGDRIEHRMHGPGIEMHPGYELVHCTQVIACRLYRSILDCLNLEEGMLYGRSTSDIGNPPRIVIR